MWVGVAVDGGVILHSFVTPSDTLLHLHNISLQIYCNSWSLVCRLSQRQPIIFIANMILLDYLFFFPSVIAFLSGIWDHDGESNCIIKYRLNTSGGIMKLHWGQPAHSIPDMQMLSALNQPITHWKACALKMSPWENCVFVCLGVPSSLWWDCRTLPQFVTLLGKSHPAGCVSPPGCQPHSHTLIYISGLIRTGPFGPKSALQSCLVFRLVNSFILKQRLIYGMQKILHSKCLPSRGCLQAFSRKLDFTIKTL